MSYASRNVREALAKAFAIEALGNNFHEIEDNKEKT